MWVPDAWQDWPCLLQLSQVKWIRNILPGALGMFIGKKRVASHSRSLWLQTEAEFLDNRMYINITHLYINKTGRPTEKKKSLCVAWNSRKRTERQSHFVWVQIFTLALCSSVSFDHLSRPSHFQFPHLFVGGHNTDGTRAF